MIEPIAAIQFPHIPAQAGIHQRVAGLSCLCLGPRFRGDERLNG